MQVSVQSARKNLSKLIDAALAGEEVVIARGEAPVRRSFQSFGRVSGSES
jgi:antitoxin (DNA-binding transcriptional repressor) of toxin-antitoxin stability system